MLSERILQQAEELGLNRVEITYEAVRQRNGVDVGYRLACSACPHQALQLNEPFADQSLPHYHSRDGGPIVWVVAGYEVPLRA